MTKKKRAWIEKTKNFLDKYKIYGKIINAIVLLLFGLWGLKINCDIKKLTEISLAEPEFEIAFGKSTPPDSIFSQKASPFTIFRPSSEAYNKVDEDKIGSKVNHVSITNIGKIPSPQTFVEISVLDPFSIALIAVYKSDSGWLSPVDKAVQIPDVPEYQNARLTISKIIQQEKRIEVYLLIVYSKSKKEKYVGQEKIENALKITVHSSVQKVHSPWAKSIELSF